MARMSKHSEWRLEPTDADGDIIDLTFLSSEVEALAAIPSTFEDFADAAYIDVCRVERFGSADDGVKGVTYRYTTRHYRGGRTVTLATEAGVHPVEVSA